MKVQGIAVAFNPFLSYITSTGLDPPALHVIKNSITTHGLGDIKKKKQVFNLMEEGCCISRCKEDGNVPTNFKSCVLIKMSAFSHEAWGEFAKCKYLKKVSGLSLTFQVNRDVRKVGGEKQRLCSVRPLYTSL